jgi:hypothetical protein
MACEAAKGKLERIALFLTRERHLPRPKQTSLLAFEALAPIMGAV